MRRIDLTGPQREALREVFMGVIDRFESVAVYGSRATGRARPGSDVDLVLYGAKSPGLRGEVMAALEESDLSVFADVTLYEQIGNDRLRESIDREALVLFVADALRAGAGVA